MASDPTRARFARGLRLALSAKPAASKTEAAGDAEAPAPKPPNNLQGVGDGGGGLGAAFSIAKSEEEAFFDLSKGQQHFEARVMDAQGCIEPVSKEMCYVCEWYPEPWPLENKDRTSTALFLSGMPINAELELPPAPERENVLVFADRGGCCKRIFDQAPERRVKTVEYVETPLAELEVDDLKELVQKEKWGLIVFGSGLDLPASNGIDDIMQVIDDLSRTYLELVKVIARNKKNCKRVACLTRDVFAEDPKKHRKVGVRLAALGSLWGMSNSVRLEFEELPLAYVDIEMKPSEECLKQVASELFCLEVFGQNTVRILNSGRYVMRQVLGQHYQVREPSFEVPSSGVIAITGGNGSLAQVFVMHLLEMAERKNAENPGLPPCSFTIKLLSRSAVVRDREAPVWAQVVRKAAMVNIDVQHVKCDVTQADSIERFIEEHSPNITGIIHTAGILQDAMLPGQTWEKFETCLGCKSRACIYLHDSLERHANPNLDIFWVFSSNSIYGNPGQTNYGGANTILDAVVRHRVAMGKPGFSIQWGAWGEAGMAAAMDERMKQGIAMSHLPFFSNQEGFAGMYAGLNSGIPSACVQKYNPSVLIPTKMQQGHYERNFVCEFCPTGPPKAKKVKSEDMYWLYRNFLEVDGSRPPRASGIIYQTFSKAQMQEEEDDDKLW